MRVEVAVRQSAEPDKLRAGQNIVVPAGAQADKLIGRHPDDPVLAWTRGTSFNDFWSKLSTFCANSSVSQCYYCNLMLLPVIRPP